MLKQESVLETKKRKGRIQEFITASERVLFMKGLKGKKCTLNLTRTVFNSSGGLKILTQIPAESSL